MPAPLRFVQQQLDLGTEVNGAVFSIDEQGEHGEVFTRRWIVELIFDLSGFTADRDLAGMVALEPSCGSGAFLVPMTERLIESCRSHSRPLGDIAEALVAYDLLPSNVDLARKAVASALIESGVTADEAAAVAEGCVRCGDFLLSDHGNVAADFAVRLRSSPGRRNAIRWPAEA